MSVVLYRDAAANFALSPHAERLPSMVDGCVIGSGIQRRWRALAIRAPVSARVEAHCVRPLGTRKPPVRRRPQPCRIRVIVRPRSERFAHIIPVHRRIGCTHRLRYIVQAGPPAVIPWLVGNLPIVAPIIIRCRCTVRRINENPEWIGQKAVITGLHGDVVDLAPPTTCRGRNHWILAICATERCLCPSKNPRR
jgi:hypothetical protein